MTATRLATKYVEKPWGRHSLPGFFPEGGGRQIGEVWFDGPDGQHPPILVKYIFTSERLSIQVHPNDAQGQDRGLPGGKSECWLILDAEPDARLGMGTLRPLSGEQLRETSLDGEIETLMDWKPVKPGDFMYCASDTIHAIGGGLTVIEVQQNSETTYRLYDYGSDRELHLKDGIEVADPTPYVPVAPPIEVETGRTIMVEGPKFVLERWKGGDHVVNLPEGTTGWVIPITGSGDVAGVAFKAGECATMTGSETVSTSADADVLFAYPLAKRI